MPTLIQNSSESGMPARLKVPTAAEAAAQAIRDAIMVGRLKPGDRIREQHWAASLGVGQPTIREALRELEYQGLVAKSPHRGTYVSELQTQDYRQLLEVRLSLETLAIEKAVCNLDDRAERELTDLVSSMEQAVEKRDLALFHESDVAFHRRIWDLAGNPYLKMCLETLCLRLFVFSVLGERPDLEAENRASVAQHWGTLAGLRTRDPQRASAEFLKNTVAYWNEHYGLDLKDPSR
jgi:DNA-binding GntR family transcriptional regulator